MYSHRYITSLWKLKKIDIREIAKDVIENDCTLVRKSLLIVRLGGPQ